MLLLVYKTYIEKIFEKEYALCHSGLLSNAETGLPNGLRGRQEDWADTSR